MTSSTASSGNKPQAKSATMAYDLIYLATVSTFLCFLLMLLIAAFAPARADSIVTLKTATEIDRPTVRLSDVFEGVPPAIDREIATAPAPGKVVSYNVKILTALADQYRLDWQPQSVMDAATLTRATTKITADMIRDVVQAKLKDENLNGTVEIAIDGRQPEINLPASSAADFALNNFAYDDANKRFRADLVAAAGTPGMVTMPLAGHVTVKREVPVLAHRLEAGVTIGASDVTFATLTTDHIAADMVTDTSQLVGRELRHDAAEGAPLRTRDIIPPRFVNRGATVLMKIETPSMVLTAQGRVLQDGGKGDTVRVINTRSNRTVEGIVEAPGVVRIDATTKLASAG